MRSALAAAMLVVTMTTSPLHAEILRFSDLDGWAADDHRAALLSFRETCELLTDPDWVPLCNLAADCRGQCGKCPTILRVVLSSRGDRRSTGAVYRIFRTGIAGLSRADATVCLAGSIAARRNCATVRCFHTRAAIEGGILRGRGLELAWLDDPVDVYFLQVQGSGRIRMPDGEVIRVGYAGRNGHAYRSVGQEMVRRGTHTVDQVSAQEISAHVRQGAGADLLNINPSYVFFRRLDDLPAEKGPIGAMGRSITTFRSVAIDPDFTPLGAPVWIEKDGANPIRALMVAQDTGGAIKGPQRADIFYGTGCGRRRCCGNHQGWWPHGRLAAD